MINKIISNAMSKFFNKIMIGENRVYLDRELTDKYVPIPLNNNKCHFNSVHLSNHLKANNIESLVIPVIAYDRMYRKWFIHFLVSVESDNTIKYIDPTISYYDDIEYYRINTLEKIIEMNKYIQSDKVKMCMLPDKLLYSVKYSMAIKIIKENKMLQMLYNIRYFKSKIISNIIRRL